MNITELKEHDPKRFEREYWKWAEHEPGYNWWDCTYEHFVETAAAAGVEVNPKDIEFSISYSQGDGATFAASVDFAPWMEKHGYAEKYVALYQDALEYGAHCSVRKVWRGGWSMSANLEFSPGNCVPSGVFKDLPQEAWDALVEEQLAAEDWERLILDHCNDLSSDLYRALVAEYEYLTSEEQFIESCECNDVTFDLEEA